MVVCIDFIGYLKLPLYTTSRLYLKARYVRRDDEVTKMRLRLVYGGETIFEKEYDATQSPIDIAEVIEAQLPIKPVRVECIKSATVVYPLYNYGSIVAVVVGGGGASLTITSVTRETCTTIVPSSVTYGASSLIVKSDSPVLLDAGLNKLYIMLARPADIDKSVYDIDVVIDECTNEKCITWMRKIPIYAFECAPPAEARVDATVYSSK